MCNYCQGEDNLYSMNQKGDDVEIYLDDTLIVLSIGKGKTMFQKYCALVKIKFCPMCGRELGE